MSAPQKSGRPRSALRGGVSRTLKVLTASTVTLALVAAGAVALSRVHRHQRTQHLQATVDATYAATRPAADRRHRTGDTLVAEVLGPHTFQASSVRCVLNGEDAGLIKQNWRLDCAIRTVDAYRTDLPYPRIASQLQQRADAFRGDPLVLGRPVTTTTPPHGCGTLRAHSGESPLDASVTISRLQAGHFEPTEHTGDPYHGCSAPVPVYDLPTTRVEVAYPDTAVDPQHSWLTVERDTPFLSQSLGCAPPWCGVPVAEHVLPRP